jgi:hypothetical protein
MTDVKFENEEQACDFLQPYMDKAYELYQKPENRNWGFGDFLMHLNVQERGIVAIGKLNQQVCNGGFAQWRDNGYDERPEFLFQALRELNTEWANKTMKLVEQALELDMECEDEYGDVDECEYDALQDSFDELDNKFYSFNGDLLCDLASHVACSQVLQS